MEVLYKKYLKVLSQSTERIKRIPLFCIIIVGLLQTCSCNNKPNIKDDISRKVTKNIEIQQKPIQSKQTEKNRFTRSSLQDGFYVIVNDKIFTGIGQGSVFEYTPQDKIYPYNTEIFAYLELDRAFSVDKIFKYGNKMIYVIKQEDDDPPYNQVIKILVWDTSTGKKEIAKLGGFGSGNYYLLGDRVYFDGYVTGENDFVSTKYVIKYINIDTLLQKEVCTYEKIFKDASFVLKEDGSLAFLVTDESGYSEIITYNKGVYSEIVKNKKWCILIEYDNRGIWYTAPDKKDSMIDDPLNIECRNLILNFQNNDEKIISRVNDNGNLGQGIIIFDKFFLLTDIRDSCIEKYDFDGRLIKKFELKKWPALGRGGNCQSNITYYDGVIKNLFYRGDKNTLEVQDISID